MKGEISDFIRELINQRTFKELIKVIDQAIETKDVNLLNQVVQAYCIIGENADIYMHKVFQRYIDFLIKYDARQSIIDTLTLKNMHPQAITEGFELLVNYGEYEVAKAIVSILCERVPSLELREKLTYQELQDVEIAKSHLMYILPIILRSTYLDIAIQIYDAKANPERSTYIGYTTINSALGEGLIQNNLAFVGHIIATTKQELHSCYYEDIKSVEMLKLLLSKDCFRNALKSRLVREFFKRGRSELLKYLYTLESFPKEYFALTQNRDAALESRDYKTIKFMYKVSNISQEEKNKNLMSYIKLLLFFLNEKSLRFLISEANLEILPKSELKELISALDQNDMINEAVYLMKFKSSIDLALVQECRLRHSCVKFYLYAYFGQINVLDEVYCNITNVEFYNKIFDIESTWSTKDMAARIVSTFTMSQCNYRHDEIIFAQSYAKFRYINKSFADLTFSSIGDFGFLPLAVVKKIFALVSNPQQHSCSSEALVSGGMVHNLCRYASTRNIYKMRGDIKPNTKERLLCYAVNRGDVTHPEFTSGSCN